MTPCISQTSMKMTPYELLSHDFTVRVNDNCYYHFAHGWGGEAQMWYMGDEEFEQCLFELKVDLAILEKRKRAKQLLLESDASRRS